MRRLIPGRDRRVERLQARVDQLRQRIEELESEVAENKRLTAG
jgi:cell division protein FtsB